MFNPGGVEQNTRKMFNPSGVVDFFHAFPGLREYALPWALMLNPRGVIIPTCVGLLPIRLHVGIIDVFQNPAWKAGVPIRRTPAPG